MALALKILTPHRDLHTTRTFHWDASTLVSKAVAEIGPTQGVSAIEEWGLFVPSWRGYERVQGWLQPDVSFEEQHVAAGYVLEFRPRERKVQVTDARLQETLMVEWDDTEPVATNVIRLLRATLPSSYLKMMPPNINRRVTIINKASLLLDFPLPSDATYSLACTEGWLYSEEVSTEDLLANVYFFVCTPYLEGMLHKKTKTGLKRGWKRRWVVLVKDTLQYYSAQASDTPLGGVHLRNVQFCHQSEPIDSTSKKLGHVFKISTVTEKTLYLATPSKDVMTRWLSSLETWMRFQPFFKPKAIKERGFALSHILSGQIRPNPKTGNLPRGSVEADEAGSGAGVGSRARASSIMESTSEAATEAVTDAPEVQPNREISVVVKETGTREMIVDSRLDVYELAYMIAEEITSAQAFVIGPRDHGPLRRVELLDHQSSLASQNVPLSAKFVVKKTGIVDDFIGPNDIYDNHFLYVQLPYVTSNVLVESQDEAEWREVSMRFMAGKFSLVQPDELQSLVDIPMWAVSSLRVSRKLTTEYPEFEEHAFCMEVRLGGEERVQLHFLAGVDNARAWCNLGAWCGFFHKNALLDPVKVTRDTLATFQASGTEVPDVYAWLGVDPQAKPPPVSPRGDGAAAASAASGAGGAEGRSDDGEEQEEDEIVLDERSIAVHVSSDDDDAVASSEVDDTASVANSNVASSSSSASATAIADSAAASSQRSASPPPVSSSMPQKGTWRRANVPKGQRRRSVEQVAFDDEERTSPTKTAAAPTVTTAAPRQQQQQQSQPQQDTSRQIRQAFESVDAVKLKSLPEGDSSPYAWKVVHSVTRHQLGYAAPRDDKIVFFNLKGQELLSVPWAHLPGLKVPSHRQKYLSKTRRHASKRDMLIEIRQLYNTQDRIILTRAVDAEFKYRVALADGKHVGWANKTGKIFVFFDVDGNPLSPKNKKEQNNAVSVRQEVRRMYGNRHDVHFQVSKRNPHYQFKVLQEDGSQLGWITKGAFDYSFFTTDNLRLARMPLMKLDPVLKEDTADGAAEKSVRKRFNVANPTLGKKGGSTANRAPRKKLLAASRIFNDTDRTRSESVDYTPDGLSPELVQEGYDPASSHRPMGLFGLMQEPDSSEE